MRHSILYALGFGAVLWCMASLTAAAETAPYDINQQAVLCDTLAQIQQIASADDPYATYKSLAEIEDPAGEPTCELSYYGTVPSDGAQDIGLMILNGKKWDATAVHIINNGAEAYILKALPHADVQPSKCEGAGCI